MNISTSGQRKSFRSSHDLGSLGVGLGNQRILPGPRWLGSDVNLDALILTSNRGFSQWNEFFGDPVIATAILDRILYYSTTINIKGNSYRLKEKVKAGLI